MTSRTITLARRRESAKPVVAAGATSWLLFVVAAMTTGMQNWHLSAVLALMVFGACWIGGRLIIGDIAERRAADVDEYELGQRTSARDVGYQAALACLIMLFVYGTFALQMAERGKTGPLDQAPTAAFSAFLLCASLPTFLLTWRQRTSAAAYERDDIDEGRL